MGQGNADGEIARASSLFSHGFENKVEGRDADASTAGSEVCGCSRRFVPRWSTAFPECGNERVRRRWLGQ